MVGYSHRVQIRHVVVDKEEVANLLKGFFDDIKTHKGRVQSMMKLAEKYSTCFSKDDGGNLGWLELSSDDPRKLNYAPVFKNQELEKIIREKIADRSMKKEDVFGPFKTEEGFHITIISNSFGGDFIPNY